MFQTIDSTGKDGENKYKEKEEEVKTHQISFYGDECECVCVCSLEHNQ